MIKLQADEYENLMYKINVLHKGSGDGCGDCLPGGKNSGTD